MKIMTKIMTFNIRGAVHDDGENAWPKRAALNVETIRRADPDLIGFQEFQDGNREYYDRELTGYERCVGPRYGNAEPYEYAAIYWKPDRLSLVDSGGFWLSTTPDEYSGAWETVCIRCAAWVRLRPADGGREFLHLNTHLDHRSVEARVRGAELILRRLGEIAPADEPVVVTGDFNCLPEEEPYRAFMNVGYTDAHSSAGDFRPEDSDTFHGFRGRGFWRIRRGEGPRRIDYILTQGLEVGPCEVLRDEAPPVYPSDHYPLVAVFAPLS